METLNEFELSLLENLVYQHPKIRAHIPHLLVLNRECTGVGMYINFCDYNLFGAVDLFIGLPYDVLSPNERIIIPELQYGLGYEVDLSEGKIRFIEIFTYGEEWNCKISKFKLENL